MRLRIVLMRDSLVILGVHWSTSKLERGEDGQRVVYHGQVQESVYCLFYEGTLKND